ncbi:MAG TPA: hypothetical protein VM344_01180, partial [Vitreimonas sp.]|nr:hypothetical protein [Vitreimonas sp.]
AIGFALLPHDGSWADADVLAQAERYRHPMLVARGTGDQPAAQGGPATETLRECFWIEGDGVVLSSLRRRDAWLEARVVAKSAQPRVAVLHGPFDSAREADILGRPGRPLETEPGRLEMRLGPWEIRTVQLRAAKDQLPD